MVQGFVFNLGIFLNDTGLFRVDFGGRVELLSKLEISIVTHESLSTF